MIRTCVAVLALASACVGLVGCVSRNGNLLRTGEPVKTVDFWGFETLRPGDLRIAPQGLGVGDVIRIVLK